MSDSIGIFMIDTYNSDNKIFPTFMLAFFFCILKLSYLYFQINNSQNETLDYPNH